MYSDISIIKAEPQISDSTYVEFNNTPVYLTVPNDCTVTNVTLENNTTCSLGGGSNGVAFGIVEIVLTVLVIGGCVSIIVIFTAFSRLRLLSNAFVVNLAVADLTFGAAMAINAAFDMDDTLSYSPGLCIFRAWLVSASMVGSLCAMLVASVDRFIAVCYPLSYQAIIGVGRTAGLLSAGWIVSAIISSVPLPIILPMDDPQCCQSIYVYPKTYNVICLSILTVLLSVNIAIYIYISVTAWRQFNRIEDSSRVLEMDQPSGDRKNSYRRPPDVKIRKEMALEKAKILSKGFFIACWLPFLVISFLVNTDQTYNNDDLNCIAVSYGQHPRVQWNDLDIALEVTLVLCLLNSCRNVLVHGPLNRDYRWAMGRLCGSHRFKTRVGTSSSPSTDRTIARGRQTVATRSSVQTVS